MNKINLKVELLLQFPPTHIFMVGISRIKCHTIQYARLYRCKQNINALRILKDTSMGMVKPCHKNRAAASTGSEKYSTAYLQLYQMKQCNFENS